MKYIAIVCSVMLAGTCAAGRQHSKASDAADKAYAKYRAVNSEPKFGLAKVRTLLKSLAGTFFDAAISDPQFNSLTSEEKFTYCMLHGEWSDQGCSGMPVVSGERGVIFAYPPNGFPDQSRWSDRQTTFLRNSQSTVDNLLRATIQEDNRVGVNFKMAINELNLIELIPDILAVYAKDRKDHDILSVCMVLMNSDHYKPFMATKIYKDLYIDKPGSNYKYSVPATRENEDLIIKQASAFAKSKGF